MAQPGNRKLRHSVRGKKAHFFDAAGVDELVAICVALAQELWVVKERLAIYESLHIKKGNVLPKDLDQFNLPAKQRDALDTENREFIDRIFFVLREQAEATEPDSDEPPPPRMP